MRKLGEKGRRPVIAFMDTGCGEHPWFTAPDVVKRQLPQNADAIGLTDDPTDPERHGDQAGPFDGFLDGAAGHGTFVAGILHQSCPDATLIPIRVADSQGTVLEGEFLKAVRDVALAVLRHAADKGGQPIDVLNISLGYYHETPEDELYDTTMSQLLGRARQAGCAVVCSAGNDATDRPSFPAALWPWPGADFHVEEPANAAPHVSVGAMNPNHSIALFSNIGRWVKTWAPGVSVLSTSPPFRGGAQAGSRNDRGTLRRESLDPDDYSAGFALWSGTSFAAPLVAGRLACEMAGPLMSGELGREVEPRVDALRKAAKAVDRALPEVLPR